MVNGLWRLALKSKLLCANIEPRRVLEGRIQDSMMLEKEILRVACSYRPVTDEYNFIYAQRLKQNRAGKIQFSTNAELPLNLDKPY